MNILITGIAGSGKTTIAAELKKRGYNSINMDAEEGLCAWVNIATGKPDKNFVRNSANDWDGKYDWLWNDKKLKQLISESKDTYFCGSSGNQTDYYKLFDKCFLLEMDEQLLRDRVSKKKDGDDYGKKPGELEAILSYMDAYQTTANANGLIVIDAHKSVSEIIDIIVGMTT